MTAMRKDDCIYVAGHRGLVGSAILRRLRMDGYTNLCTARHDELDLTDQAATLDFFRKRGIEYVFLAAAKVGGIYANSRRPAEFIRDNLAIQLNVLHSAYACRTQRLLFLGSSCIYPKFAPQPIKETALLSGPLEATNRPYALAKIAGIEMCWSYNRQYGTKFLAAMPTNLFGAGDNYDLENSHVIPALIRKFHEAKARSEPVVSVWGTGAPRREFLYSDDMANACVFLMNLPSETFDSLLGSTLEDADVFDPPIVNIGVGEDITIEELAREIATVTDFNGAVEFDASKPDGTPRKVLDVSKITSLGWKAGTSLRNGLQKTYADFLRSPTP